MEKVRGHTVSQSVAPLACPTRERKNALGSREGGSTGSGLVEGPAGTDDQGTAAEDEDERADVDEEDGGERDEAAAA